MQPEDIAAHLERIKSEGPAKGTRQARVSRERGTCDFCGAEGHVIIAYDPRAYDGRACPKCVIGGRTSERYDVKGGVMRPMVFVARALLGVQPFARMLKAAEEQREKERRKAERRASTTKSKRRKRHPRLRKKRKA